MIGRTIPGLLEMILSCSIGEVYRHVVKTVFPSQDQTSICNNSVKRKLSENSKEEPSRKYREPTSGKPIEAVAETTGFIAVSRGNRLLSIYESLKNQSNKEQAGIHLSQLEASSPLAISDRIQCQDRLSEILNNKPGESVASSGNTTEVDSVQKTPMQENLGTSAEKLTLHIRWKSNLGKCVDASPLVVIPAADELSTSVYIGSHSHNVQAIDLFSGKVRWERNLADRIESSACVSKCGNFIILGMFKIFLCLYL